MLMLNYYGFVWGQGNNSIGALGVGDTFYRSSAILIKDLPIITSISCGANFSCFISEEKKLYVTGDNSHGAIGIPKSKEYILKPDENLHLSHVKKVQCGEFFSLVLNEFGSVFTCGKNDQGQLGVSSNGNSNLYSFKQIENSVSDKNIIDIACGLHHSLLLSQNGTVYTCGKNDHLQCGKNKKKKVISIFTKIRDLENIQQISCGNYYSLCVNSSGEGFIFGDYRLQPQDHHCYQLQVPNAITFIASGFYNCSIVECEGNEFYGFGENKDYQLGIQDSKLLTKITKLPNFSGLCKPRELKYNNSTEQMQENRNSYVSII